MGSMNSRGDGLALERESRSQSCWCIRICVSGGSSHVSSTGAMHNAKLFLGCWLAAGSSLYGSVQLRNGLFQSLDLLFNKNVNDGKKGPARSGRSYPQCTTPNRCGGVSQSETENYEINVRKRQISGCTEVLWNILYINVPNHKDAMIYSADIQVRGGRCLSLYICWQR